MRKPRLLALVAGLALALAAPALPASAHNSSGEAQLSLQKVTAAPSPTAGQYQLTVQLADRDSGEPLSFFAVSIEGSGGNGASIPPTAAAAGLGGKYTAGVPAAAGDWTLTIRGNSSPDAGAAVPLVVSQAITFSDKETSVTPSGAGGGGGGGGGGASALVGVVAALALLGVGGAMLMKRKAERLAGAPAGR